MSTLVFLAVLSAALMHAAWNALIRSGENKQAAMLVISAGQAVVGLGFVVTRPMPAPEVWPWLLASGVIHMAYQLFLAFAYEQGDLSRVYPIARGAAPLMVTVFGLMFLSEDLRPTELAGIAVLGAGLMLMARGVFTNGESLRLLPLALGSATATAAYSIVDGLGARVSGDALNYVGWLLLLATVFYVPAIIYLRGAQTIPRNPRSWVSGFVAGSIAFTAYAIVVWAMTQAPIPLVTALRESSILFAVLIGITVFGERFDRGKALAALLILVGVIVTRL